MKVRSIAVAVIAVLVLAGLGYAFSNVRKGYAPRQPIAFSHKRMAGEPVIQVNDKGEKTNVGGFGIPCVYCHTMPYKGRHSTLPSTAVWQEAVDRLAGVFGVIGLARARAVVQR